MKRYIYLIIITTYLLSGCKSNDPELPNNSANNTTTESSLPIKGKFKKNVLLEDFTGTWCKYCPIFIYGIQKIESEKLAVVPVSIHRGFTNSGGDAFDPFSFPAENLESKLGVNGAYPFAIFNRKVQWSQYLSLNTPKGLIKPNCDIGFAMNSTFIDKKINLNVTIKADSALANLKLIVYLLEDSLTADQANDTQYFIGNPVKNMVHDHVLKAGLTDIGEGLALDKTVKGQVVTKNFNQAVPSNVSNAANISFVAFVTNSSGEVVNVRSSRLGENQLFEENP